MPSQQSLQIKLYPLLSSIANATDLISPILHDHQQQVSFIAAMLGQALGLSTAEVQQLAMAGAVHDIGGLSIRRRLETFEFEMIEPDRHTVPGYVLLSSFPPFAELARLVRFHHVYWQNGRGLEYRGEAVPSLSHLLHLADRIAVQIDPTKEILSQKDGIIQRIVARSGEMFSPDQVEAFRTIAEKEVFWFDLTSPRIREITQERLPLDDLLLGCDELPGLAELFRKIIDFRSRFTATHSSGVAATGVALAAKSGFTAQGVDQMLLAGLLHDIGKLVVPAEILAKHAPLTTHDFAVIRKHPYYTAWILQDLEGFGEITRWAALHHERLDGSGYPYRPPAADLPDGARILAVADTFTALTEDRPYRCAMSRGGTNQVLQGMATHNKLDRDYVALITGHHEEFDHLRHTAQAAADTEHRRFLAECNLESPHRDADEYCPVGREED